MLRDNKTKRILDELKHNTRTAREIFEELFPYNPDTYKFSKRLLGYMARPKKMGFEELKRLEQKRFYTLLSKLRREGVVKKRKIGARVLWGLTKNGFKKLTDYTKQKQYVDMPKRAYVKEKVLDQTLIIFDIPESLKHYRNWIRYHISLLGFIMLQKSVWVGTYQIPADFIHDLRESNLLRYVHFFKITKTGSIMK